MLEQVQRALPYVPGLLAVVAGLLLVGAFYYFWRSRREAYWRWRRDASRLGLRLFVGGIGLLTLAGVLAGLGFLSNWLTLDDRRVRDGTSEMLVQPEMSVTPPNEGVLGVATPTSSPAVSALATETQLPASPTTVPTPLPSFTVMAGPTESPIPVPTDPPAAMVSPTMRATSTPSPTMAVYVEPRVSSVTPGPGVSMAITGVATQVDSEFRLQSPAGKLSAGATRIYFELTYEQMTSGAAWERVLLRGDEMVQGGAYVWTDPADGEAVYFFGASSGFPAGAYQIRIYLGGLLAAQYSFELE